MPLPRLIMRVCKPWPVAYMQPSQNMQSHKRDSIPNCKAVEVHIIHWITIDKGIVSKGVTFGTVPDVYKT